MQAKLKQFFHVQEMSANQIVLPERIQRFWVASSYSNIRGLSILEHRYSRFLIITTTPTVKPVHVHRTAIQVGLLCNRAILGRILGDFAIRQ